MHRTFWEPFLLGTSTAVNSVAALISGVTPELGFRFKKKNPLLRFVYIHTENRHITFDRKSIYAGFCECIDTVDACINMYTKYAPSILDIIGFVDVGNRTVKHPDGTKSGDWRQALIEVRA